MAAAIMKALEQPEKYFLSPEAEIGEFGFNDPEGFGRHVFVGNFPAKSIYTDSFLAVAEEFKANGMVRGKRHDITQPVYPGAIEGTISFWLKIKEG